MDIKAFTESIGKTITALTLTDNALCFTFSDNTQIKLADESPACCEYRYAYTDDDLNDFINSQLLGLEVKDASPTDNDNGDTVEVQFLEIQTSKGVFTVSTHNEHNGNYSGFNIHATRVN